MEKAKRDIIYIEIGLKYPSLGVVYYNYLKQVAKDGVPGAKPIYDD